MYKIALIRPYFPESFAQKSFPLGLGYLAAILRQNGYFVQIYDLNIINFTNQQILPVLKKLQFDFIGISALTVDFTGMIELAQLIKQDTILQGNPLILGGIHVSYLPEYSLRQTHADIVCIGEAERTIIELLEALILQRDLMKVQGIGFIQDDVYHQTPLRELIKNLDELPFPAWDLIHPELYKTVHGTFYKKKPVFPIFSTRGCPYQCTFCASKNFWRQRLRFRSVKNVVDEIEFLQKTYSAKEIQIWDDNFTLNRKYVIDFCREILKRKIHIAFSCPNGVRIDTFDRRLLRILRGVGFYSLIYAIESGSQPMLNSIYKQLNLKIVPDIVEMTRKEGYFIRSSFIIGLPGENAHTVYETLNLALELPFDTAYFFIFNPIPGSTFFEEWIKGKDLDTIDWNFDFFKNPHDMARFYSLPADSLPKLQILFNIKFFLFRPWKIIKYFLQYHMSQYNLIISRIAYLIKGFLKIK